MKRVGSSTGELRCCASKGQQGCEEEAATESLGESWVFNQGLQGGEEVGVL